MPIRAQDAFAKLPEERREKIEKRAAELIAQEMTLNQLRQALKQSQEQLAMRLNIKQAAMSRLERRTDMYIKTLRRIIEGMGGELQITATFPDMPPVRLTQFGVVHKRRQKARRDAVARSRSSAPKSSDTERGSVPPTTNAS